MLSVLVLGIKKVLKILLSTSVCLHMRMRSGGPLLRAGVKCRLCPGCRILGNKKCFWKYIRLLCAGRDCIPGAHQLRQSLRR